MTPLPRGPLKRHVWTLCTYDPFHTLLRIATRQEQDLLAGEVSPPPHLLPLSLILLKKEFGLIEKVRKQEIRENSGKDMVTIYAMSFGHE